MNLEQTNHALKTAKAGISVEVHSDRLYLRGTFPPKPGSGHGKPHQQRIALRVDGIPVRDNHDGLKYAKATALEMAGQLLKGQFDWAEWMGETSRPARSIGDWISEFERSYFDRRGNSPETLTTWKTNYLTVFSRLPGDSLPDRELLGSLGVMVINLAYELWEPSISRL